MELNLDLSKLPPRVRDKLIDAIILVLSIEGGDIKQDMKDYPTDGSVTKQMRDWHDAIWKLHGDVIKVRKEIQQKNIDNSRQM